MSTSLKKRPLPPGWRWAKLNQVARVFSGSAAPQEQRFFVGGTNPFLRVSDLGPIRRSRCLTEIRDRVNDFAVKELGLVPAKAGTVVFPKSGAAITTNSRAILGIDAFLVSHLAAVTALENATIPEWLYYWLCRLNMLNYSDNPGYPSLRISRVASIAIPVPSLDEQRRITARLSEQMDQVKRMRQAAHAQVEDAKALPAALLRQVFESEGVEAWPRIRLGEVCEIVGGNTLPQVFDADNEEKVYCLKVSDLDGPFSDGRSLSGGALRTTRRAAGARVLRPGAVVFPKRGGAIATNKKRILKIHAVLDPNLMGIQPITVEAVSPSFLYWWLESWDISSLQSGTAVPQINQQDLSPLLIPIPPLAEQKRIAAILTEKIGYVENLRIAAEDQLGAVDVLPGALLDELFGGLEPPE